MFFKVFFSIVLIYELIYLILIVNHIMKANTFGEPISVFKRSYHFLPEKSQFVYLSVLIFFSLVILIFIMFDINSIKKDILINIIFTVDIFLTILTLIIGFFNFLRKDYMTENGIVTSGNIYYWKDLVGYKLIDSHNIEIIIEKKTFNKWKHLTLNYVFENEKDLNSVLGFFYIKKIIRRIK